MFNEEVFIWSLCTRPEDAKKYALTFKPDWLENAQLIPILAELYAFTRKHGTPPSLNVLKQIFIDKDKQLYEQRFFNIFDKLENLAPDVSDILYTLDKAKNVAATRSFAELVSDHGFSTLVEQEQGDKVLVTLKKWINSFETEGDIRSTTIKDAIEELVAMYGFIPKQIKIPCGIKPIDDWCSGGLRTKNIGIIMAPTGKGKSASLVVIAHKVASVQEKNIWFITNELTIPEITERFLARLTGKQLDIIMEDPGVAYIGLERHWQKGLNKRLRITEITKPPVTTDEIESEMMRWQNISGWKPDVIVLDFMERMKPNISGIRRDNEWVWLQAVAQDLISLAKRHNLLIWTACQTNRAGLSAASLDLSMGQSSVRHFQEASAVIGLNQTILPGERDKIGITFFNLKMRQGKGTTESITVECDLSRMSISNNIIKLPDLVDRDDDEDDNTYTPRQKQRKGKKK